jgi:hypothetical protein
MKSFLLFVLLGILLSGCYTRRKADRQVSMAAVTFPDILAKKARDLFPCVTKGGDTIWVSDSSQYVSVLDELQSQYAEMYYEKDSLNKILDGMKDDTLSADMIDALREVISQRDKKIELILNKVNHIPPITITKTIHDTTVDNAAVEACKFDLNETKGKLEKQTTRADNNQKKMRTRGAIMWGEAGLLLIILGLILYNFLRPKLKVVK